MAEAEPLTSQEEKSRESTDDSRDAVPASLTEKPKARHARLRNLCIVVIIGALWLALDIATKRFFGNFEVGELVGGPYGGIFCFRIVHNTGAAWGIFNDTTIALGVLAVVVCILILIYLFVVAPRSSAGAAFGLALVVAGGVGNAIDRFTAGYVIDFIDPVFINFPVFNVADIGVTCGIIIFIIALIVQWVTGRNRGAAGADDAGDAVERAAHGDASVTADDAADDAVEASVVGEAEANIAGATAEVRKASEAAEASATSDDHVANTNETK